MSWQLKMAVSRGPHVHDRVRQSRRHADRLSHVQDLFRIVTAIRCRQLRLVPSVEMPVTGTLLVCPAFVIVSVQVGRSVSVELQQPERTGRSR